MSGQGRCRRHQQPRQPSEVEKLRQQVNTFKQEFIKRCQHWSLFQEICVHYRLPPHEPLTKILCLVCILLHT